MTYKKNDLVRIIEPSHMFYRKVGTVGADQISSSWVEVLFDGTQARAPFSRSTIHPTGLERVQKASEYRKGDRVRINKVLGADGQQEGTVQGPNGLDRDAVNVLVDGLNSAAGYHYSSIELIDPAPEPARIASLAHRVTGTFINAKDVKVGDVIEVKTVVEDSTRGFKSTNTLEAEVTNIQRTALDDDVDYIWTNGGAALFSRTAPGDTTIRLVKAAADHVLEALQNFRIDAVIAFDYGKTEKRRSVAVKTSASRWHVIGGTGPKSVHTNALRILLERSGDTYDILEKGISPKG